MPARLKVLLGAVQVITSFHLGKREAMGTWRCPARTKSQWISSLTRGTPCFWHSSPTRRSSSSVHTRPTGLWGEQNTISVLAGSASFDSKSSKSMV